MQTIAGTRDRARARKSFAQTLTNGRRRALFGVFGDEDEAAMVGDRETAGDQESNGIPGRLAAPITFGEGDPP